MPEGALGLKGSPVCETSEANSETPGSYWSKNAQDALRGVPVKKEQSNSEVQACRWCRLWLESIITIYDVRCVQEGRQGPEQTFGHCYGNPTYASTALGRVSCVSKMGERALDRGGVEKLGVGNFLTWSVYMRAHFMPKDLWQFVEQQPPSPPVEQERAAAAARTEQVKWEAGCNKAWAEVTLHVEPMQLLGIIGSCNGDVQCGGTSSSSTPTAA
eukprot:1149033-Pelagomonas_calceolata.AAC.2